MPRAVWKGPFVDGYLLKKAEDLFLAFLSYCATPLRNGYSPAELLMGRKLHTTVPIILDKLRLKVPNYSQIVFRTMRTSFQSETMCCHLHCPRRVLPYSHQLHLQPLPTGLAAVESLLHLTATDLRSVH